MKAAVVRDPVDGYVDIKDVNLRPIHEGEALVKVEYCGLCHTDLHVAEGDFGKVPGRIIGHEGVGKVIQVADDVTNLKIGDRVSIAWFYRGCGHCEYCITGRETLCRNVQTQVTLLMVQWLKKLLSLPTTPLKFLKAWILLKQLH